MSITLIRHQSKSMLQASAVSLLIALICLNPFHQARSQSEDTFTLSLDNVDILSLIETVSEKTGRNFIVDPRVKAKVTIISAEAISTEKLYDLFLSVLDVHGYAAVPAGHMVKIVPLAAGVKSAVPVLGSGDELITEVIQLYNLSAEQVAEALRPMVPAPVSLVAEPNSNTVVITDHADNIARLIGIIEKLDSGQ